MKLSKKVIEILKLMNNGYELKWTNSFNGSPWWLRKGRDNVYPHGRTRVSNLLQLGYIENDGKHHFPTTPYFLTEKGIDFLKELDNDN